MDFSTPMMRDAWELSDADVLFNEFDPNAARRPRPGEADNEGGGGDVANDNIGDAESNNSKKRKVERARKACLPCRSRKCKCGGTPPTACPNCLDDNIECQWPTEDGRSSQARKERSRAKRLASMAERGLGRPPPKADRGSGANGASSSSSSTTAPAAAPLAEWDASSVVNAANVGDGWDFASGGLENMPMTVEPTALSIPSPSLDPSSLFTLPISAFDGFDTEQFILAMSAQLPTVEEGSNTDDSPPQLLAPGGGSGRTPRSTTGDGRIVKITWWRPHGPTAIAPGLKRLSLKVRVENEPRTYPSPGASGVAGDDLFGADNMPVPPVMQHLIHVFDERFGSVFPVLERDALLVDLETGSGSVFLFNCVGAMAARFSTHPTIALPSLQPHEYGNVFLKRAKDLLPNMLAVPSRETVIALCLLSHIFFGNDSEPEEWMFSGMAVRMAIDMGLHLKGSDNITPEERRLNRLTFWSVLLLDYALAFGTGRQTTFRVEEITQTFPSEDDVRRSGDLTPGSRPEAPFPYAARQMYGYGNLINLLNAPADVSRSPHEVDREITALRALAVTEYQKLPPGLQWNVANLQAHRYAQQDACFLHIHLWMHMQIASAYLTGAEYHGQGQRQRQQKSRRPSSSAGASGTTTPVCSANVWRSSARTVGEMLVLADVINPYAYLALPFVNQAFYVAGCCYIKEIENKGEEQLPKATLGHGHAPAPLTSTNPDRPRSAKDLRQIELFRSMLTSVATTSISTLQQGLARQTTYWAGVAWVAGTLAQRVSGIHADELDITEVQERIETYISMPDAGLVQRRSQEDGGGERVGRISSGGAANMTAVPHQEQTMATTDKEMAPFLELLSLPYHMSSSMTHATTTM